MWTAGNRARHDRGRLRYPGDVTDEEWAQIEPLIPPAKRGGNKRTVKLREIANGLMYILGAGCQWRAIPKDLPPRSPSHDYLDLWSWDGTAPASTRTAEPAFGPARGRTRWMRAKRSRARSGIFPSTRKAC